MGSWDKWSGARGRQNGRGDGDMDDGEHTQDRSRFNSSGTHQILALFLGPICLHPWPMAAGRLIPEEATTCQNSPMGQSGDHVGATALLCRELQWIGLLVWSGCSWIPGVDRLWECRWEGVSVLNCECVILIGQLIFQMLEGTYSALVHKCRQIVNYWYQKTRFGLVTQ